MDAYSEQPGERHDSSAEYTGEVDERDASGFRIAEIDYDGITAEASADPDVADIDDDAPPEDATDVAETEPRREVGFAAGRTIAQSELDAPELDEAAASADDEQTPPQTTERTEVRWGRGEVPQALAHYRQQLASAGHDPVGYIPERAKALRAAAPLLLNESLDDATIAEQLGVTAGYVNDMRTRLLRTLDQRVPEEVFPAAHRPAPEEHTTPAFVGAQVADLIKATGLTPTEVGRQLGIPQHRMSRFTSGTTRPDADEVLVPILRHLGLAEDIVEQIQAAYHTEIEQHRKRGA